MSEDVWRDLQPIVFVSSAGKSGCDAKFAAVSIYTDESSGRIMFGFKADFVSFVEDSTDYGVAVRVNSDDFINVTAGGISYFNQDKYSVEGAAYNHTSTGITAEVALGIKYGLSTVESIDVRVIDSQGVPSNVYAIKLENVFGEAERLTSRINSGETYSQSKKNTTQKTTKKSTKPEKTTFQLVENVPAVTYTTEPYTDWWEAKPEIPEGAETTVLTMDQYKMHKGFSYAAVAGLILLALGICVVINLKNDKKSK